MAIYDKASLVLIPSGTKTSKVYSQVPTNGDGDFTFSRSTAATRVNASGNIEKETQNLLLQSNSFNTTWQNVFTANVVGGQNGYDGTSDAWTLETQSGQASRIIQNTAGLGSVNSLSVYAKANTLDWIRLQISTATGNYVADFDLTNGVSGFTFGSPLPSIQSIGSGWYRVTISGFAPPTQVRIYAASGNNDLGGAGTIYIQDAQLEQGLVARDYIETTTTAIYGGITDNVPRLDYTDSSCPALLLEPQRTNLYPYSEYSGSGALVGFGTGTYTQTITNNYTESPEGLVNAIRFQGTCGSTIDDRSGFRDLVSVSQSDATLSFYMKSNTGSNQTLTFHYAGGHRSTITATPEWQRFDYTESSPVTSNYCGFEIRGTITDTNVDVSVYGFQMEQGSYATSYIPTYGSSVTRVYENQDATGLNSNVFNNDNLTLFYDFNYNAEGREGSTTAYRIFSGSSQLGIKGRSGSSRSMEIYSSGDFSGSIVFNNIANASRIKVALRITNGTCELFFNGAKDTETIDVSAAAPYSWGQVTMLASSSINTSLNQCLGFPTALTDQELIDLTTI